MNQLINEWVMEVIVEQPGLHRVCKTNYTGKGESLEMENNIEREKTYWIFTGLTSLYVHSIMAAADSAVVLYWVVLQGQNGQI